jgi:hypothetical protein
VYLLNRTPRASKGWKSPHEVIWAWINKREGINREATVSLKTLLAYGCKAFIMTANAQAKQHRKDLKVTSHARVGYLVNYLAGHLYQLWIPETNTVVTARDVLFNKDTFYSPADQPRGITETVQEVEITGIPAQPARLKREGGFHLDDIDDIQPINGAEDAVQQPQH